MAAIIKKRLCWNCEGRVPQQEENCLYCGVYLNGTLDKGPEETQEDFEEHQDVRSDKNDTLQNPLYTPIVQNATEPQGKSIPQLPQDEESSILSSMKLNREFCMLLLLLIGSTFLLFGLALLLFSEQGIFRLEWDASVWFVYEGIALLVLFFGWRLLNNSSEEDN